MPRASFVLQAGVIGMAAAAAVVTPPRPHVERYYTHIVYPRVQAVVTAWSNSTGVALFDALAAVAAAGLLLAWGVAIRRARRRRSWRPVGRALVGTATAAAVAYLWFVGVWGLNYARQPITVYFADEGPAPAVPGVAALAGRAAAAVNAQHAGAHQRGFPAVHATPAPLITALHEVEVRLGRWRPTVPGRPKRTLLAPFFRAAGVDGMVAPFLLETLINPDLTGPERPFVMAHEWAHLAGWAHEAEASLVAVLTTLRADPASRYSGWLFVLQETTAVLPPGERRAVLARLDEGPLEDLAAIRRRLARRVERVQRASWDVYDRYLKSQGVEEGLASYSRVVELLVRTEAIDVFDRDESTRAPESAR